MSNDNLERRAYELLRDDARARLIQAAADLEVANRHLADLPVRIVTAAPTQGYDPTKVTEQIQQATAAPTPPAQPEAPRADPSGGVAEQVFDNLRQGAEREAARQAPAAPTPQPPVEQQGSENTPPWKQQAQQQAAAAPAGEKKRRSNDDIAAEHGVALSDVKAWKDSNGGGRVVKADIEQYAKLVKEHAERAQAAADIASTVLPPEQTPPPQPQQGVVPAPRDVRSQPIAADQPLQPHDEKAFRANPQQFAPTPAPQAQQPTFQPVQQVQQPEAPQFAPQQPAQAQQPTFQPPQMQLPPGFAPTGFSPS